MTSPVLAALARLQAGTSETPIYDQMVVQQAARQLVAVWDATVRSQLDRWVEAMRPAAALVDRLVRRMAEDRAASAPEAVLERIRRDQQTLDWQESWRRERETARIVDAYTEGWPQAPEVTPAMLADRFDNLSRPPGPWHNHAWWPCDQGCPAYAQ